MSWMTRIVPLLVWIIPILVIGYFLCNITILVTCLRSNRKAGFATKRQEVGLLLFLGLPCLLAIRILERFSPTAHYDYDPKMPKRWQPSTSDSEDQDQRKLGLADRR